MNMQHYAAPMKFITICANRQQNVRNAGLSMWQYIPYLIFILFLTFLKLFWADPLPEMDPQHCSHI